MDSDTIIYHSKKRLVLFSLGSIVFVILGFWLTTASDEGQLGKLIGWSSIIFFGFGLGYLIFRFVKPTPALIISSKGIYDRASGASAGLIEWQEIKEVRAFTFMDQKLLGIFVIDPETVIRRQSILKRQILRVNSALVGTPVSIPLSMLSTKLEELESLIHARRPAN
jgi:hypothetical protein